MSRCLDGWTKWMWKAVAESPWHSSLMASPGMIHHRCHPSYLYSSSRHTVGSTPRIQTRTPLSMLTSVSTISTSLLMMDVKNCVFFRSGINTSAYMRVIGVNAKIRYFVTISNRQKHFFRRINLKGQVFVLSRELLASRRSQRRKRGEKGPSPTLRFEACQQEIGAVRSPENRIFCDDQFKCRPCSSREATGYLLEWILRPGSCRLEMNVKKNEEKLKKS